MVFQEGAEHDYAMINDPLPQKMIDQFILPNLDFEMDDMTEFIACGYWNTNHDQKVCIIWCARLMRYSFYAIVYNNQQLGTDSMEIAGFFSDGEHLIRRIVNIEDDDAMYIVEGTHHINEDEFDLSKSRKLIAEIMPNGKIAKLMSE